MVAGKQLLIMGWDEGMDSRRREEEETRETFKGREVCSQSFQHDAFLCVRV